MAEIKGKFIILTASLMGLYKNAVQEADEKLFDSTGKHFDELDPEGWYNIKYYNDFISAYVSASPSGEKAMITLGKKIYPTIKKTVGLPAGLETPLDYVEFELKGYLQNCRGPEVKPRKIISRERNRVVIQTRMTEQPCKLLEGVYLGILTLAGAPEGQVKHSKCISKGDDVCEFEITW
ncbi:MAG: hypothetical protein JW738_03910 [Actinobacteria bacterium]|nr:hypothetical protein [Actinomycetota bacterium]